MTGRSRERTDGGRRSRRVARAIVASTVLAWLACVAAASTGFPITVTDDRGVDVRLEAPPARIVSLLPSLTETVCALGACERLVGVDRFSNWPESVSLLPILGGFEDVQVERLYALRPDAVLVAESARVIDRLESLGLTVIALEPRSLDDVGRTVTTLGAVLGLPDAAEALLARIDAERTAAAARVPPAWRGARAYFEVAAVPFAAGEASFIGELLAGLGLGQHRARRARTLPEAEPRVRGARGPRADPRFGGRGPEHARASGMGRAGGADTGTCLRFRDGRARRARASGPAARGSGRPPRRLRGRAAAARGRSDRRSPGRRRPAGRRHAVSGARLGALLALAGLLLVACGFAAGSEGWSFAWGADAELIRAIRAPRSLGAWCAGALLGLAARWRRDCSGTRWPIRTCSAARRAPGSAS